MEKDLVRRSPYDVFVGVFVSVVCVCECGGVVGVCCGGSVRTSSSLKWQCADRAVTSTAFKSSSSLWRHNIN